jgi:hypothetical protein
MALTFKVQTWADDCRLPCLTEPSEIVALLKELEPFQTPSIPFQSKHLPTLKRDTWFVLKRPADKARTGLLIVWPERSACVFVSGDPVSGKRPVPRVALLRLRIDPQFLTGGRTVFAASLSASSRVLQIEDTLMWKGRSLGRDESFKKRWAMAVQWIEHYCIVDPRLLGGLAIEMAPWQPLAALQPDRVWELQADAPGQRRLLWIANNEPMTVAAPPVVFLPPVAAPSLEGPLIAVATREAGPEQWALKSADGVGLGRALVRTLGVSERLRSLKVNTVRLEVVWSLSFKKWEVKGLSELPASPGANFEAAK